jgi:hypothetical protein
MSLEQSSPELPGSHSQTPRVQLQWLIYGKGATKKINRFNLNTTQRYISNNHPHSVTRALVRTSVEINNAAIVSNITRITATLAKEAGAVKRTLIWTVN